MINEFDMKALTWDDNPLFVDRSEKIAEKIRSQIPLNTEMSGFEYGCGTGLVSFNLMPYLKHITLADSSDGMLEVLRNKILEHGVTNMDVIKSDLEVDDIPNEKYDVIFTALTLHHINDIRVILKKFYQMLNKGGYLCIADLDLENGSFHGPEFTGHFGLSRRTMRIFFKKQGLKNINASACYKIRRVNEQKETYTYQIFLITGEKI